MRLNEIRRDRLATRLEEKWIEEARTIRLRAVKTEADLARFESDFGPIRLLEEDKLGR